MILDVQCFIGHGNQRVRKKVAAIYEVTIHEEGSHHRLHCNQIPQIFGAHQVLDGWVRLGVAQRDAEYLQAYLEEVQEAFSGFSEIQNEIEKLDETETEKRGEMKARFYTVVGRTKKLLREHHGTSSDVSSRASTPAESSTPIPVALPKIELPKFDGSSEGWAAFYDLLSCLIDKNENLPAVQKLQYLRFSLTGRVASAIQSLETTEANYAAALQALRKKFECERRVLRRHWEILYEYPRLPRDTSSALTNLVDTFNQHTQALINLKATVDLWNIPLVNLISSTTGTTNATKNSSQRDHKKNRKGKPSHEQPRAQTFATTNSVACPICNEEHRIYTCDRFRALSVDDKWKAGSDASLCTNCLEKGHSNKQCKTERTCHTCRKRHHTFLHKNKPAGNQQAAGQPNPSTSQPLSEDSTVAKA
ncbi:uncharacterized protein LOC124416194 [Diprion similis]|uniref:uncharacterized protein LOC124416194 n=1 Tax=Diprion similis TaxID=362088 RepID=UPI001EF96DD3|nr:uncharacterized protein LOC124416194 [Diprion similis]